MYSCQEQPDNQDDQNHYDQLEELENLIDKEIEDSDNYTNDDQDEQ